MKLLYKNYIVTSVDIKHKVGMSWGEYASHITALEKKGFVSTETNFVDGVRANLVRLEEIGRTEYENLIDILTQFLRDAKYDFFDVERQSSELYPPPGLD